MLKQIYMKISTFLTCQTKEILFDNLQNDEVLLCGYI